ncbi:hypothetical protein Dimus_018514 [Dionaea muscipula]
MKKKEVMIEKIRQRRPGCRVACETEETFKKSSVCSRPSKEETSKQVARTQATGKKARTGKVPIVEEETELVKEPDVDTSGSPTFDESNKEVDELLARPFIFKANLEEGNERDEGAQEQQRGIEVSSEADEEEEVEERKTRR